MKKNILRVTALAVLLVMAVAVLASCGSKLSGTYKCDDTSVLDVTLTFDGDKVTAKGKVSLLSAEVTGTYKIEKDKITMTFGDDKFKLGGEKSFAKDGKTITIDGVKDTKQ